MSTSEPTDRYHHGDLKRALVEAALEMLVEGGAEAVGMRELARRVGVSAAAPYRHFRDKQALIQAVAAVGFERFHEAVEGARDGVPEDEQFGAMAEAYVKFALAHPRLYRLMFSAELGQFGDPDLRRAADAAYGSLALAAAKEDPERPGEAAISAWAFVHGLSMLLLDGQLLGVSIDNADPLVRALTRRAAQRIRTTHPA
ncbi:TetR/AcrR family transcriptional regulator [Devosia sp. ZB163]|uniref:TetR/AcrR family transcriptional regulator n=1 Tax=Devosia sp. ZB163 TaxID=3025938 RepID=UPI00235E5F09|nr:TetR/AcrR family transcriptional regulator [Devosia sp. ZB163]MDC9822587.1 TetR/AcrR family transcriptional regulator [Devosia sp. ZB163]